MTKINSLLQPHRVYFLCTLIPTAAVFIVYGFNIVMWGNRPDFGWRAMYESGPNVAADLFERAKRGGLKVGDTIKAINGKPYSTFDELFFKIRYEQPGSVNTYTVNRSGKELTINITTGILGFPTVLRRSGPLFIIGLVYFMIGVLVFLMKPQARESWLFLVMVCFVGAMVCYQSPSDLMRPLWLFHVRNLIEVFMPAALMHLPLRFPKTPTFIKNRPWIVTIPYLMSLTLFVIMQLNSTAYWNIPPILNHIYNIFIMLSVVVFIVSMIFNFLRDSSALVRLQSQVILLGIFFGFFIPVADLVIRSHWNIYLFPDPVIGFGVFLTAFPLSIGYALVKYDLFAIDALIKRTYGYILSTVSIAGVYGLFVLVSNVAFGKYEITRSPLFPLIFILAVIFLFNPIRNRVQKIIDRVFYRLEYDYQDIVKRISESMRSLLNLKQIGESIMDTALGAMFIDSGCVLLLNKENKLYECLTSAGEREIRRSQIEMENILPSRENSTIYEPGINNKATPKSESLKTAENKVLDPRQLNLMLPADAPFIQKISKRKKEVTVYDIQADPFFEDQKASCENAFDRLQATLIVPLIYENHLTGLISLGEKKSGKFYRREDINLLNTLANQGAVAIENARMIEEVIEKERMEEELSIARDLQVSMLPAACPQIQGFEIAAYSVSAMEVGGDFYDFIEMGENKVGMVIGDVTGKSVSGALVMSASRSIFRMLSEEQMSVGEIMMRANRRTKKDIKSGMFVALLYAVLDATDNTLSLCSAGQTQPIYCSSETGETKLVETKGDTFPLGILEDVGYQETRLHLAPGDKVLLYTDGIVEAMNEQEEMFGFDRLLEVLQGSKQITADALLKKILYQVNEFAGEAAQHDDLTVIVISVD